MNPLYTCDHCGQGLHSRRKLVAHLETHGEEDFACEMCNKTFLSKPRLAEHKKQKHSKDKTCPDCGSKFSHLSSLTTHIKEVHGEGTSSGPIFCQFCKKKHFIKDLLRSMNLSVKAGQIDLTFFIMKLVKKWILKMIKFKDLTRFGSGML